MSKAKKSDVDFVLNFLTKENRPFSVQNIVDALQKQGVKKTAVERSLAFLVEKGQVNKKEYGKAKIFILAQDQLQLPSADDIEETDTKIATLTEDLKSVQARCTEKRERVNQLRVQLTLAEATNRVDELTEQLATKKEKKDRLGDGSALMSMEDKAKLDEEYSKVRTAWKKYSRMVKEIVDQISEATGKKRKELYEEIGVETDEDSHVNITDYPDPSAKKRGSFSKGASGSMKRQRQS